MNLASLDQGGIPIERGILADRRIQTKLAEICAAGDLAEGLDFSTGGHAVQAIQSTPPEREQIAARDKAGLKNALHNGNITMKMLDSGGMISGTFGYWMDMKGVDSVKLYNLERFPYRKLQCNDDILVRGDRYRVIATHRVS